MLKTQNVGPWLARALWTAALWLCVGGAAFAFEAQLQGAWSGAHCTGGETSWRFNTRDQARTWVTEHWCSPHTCGDVDYRISAFDPAARTFTVQAFAGSAFQSVRFTVEFTLSEDGQTLTGLYYGHPMCTELRLTKTAAHFAGGPFDSRTPAPLPGSAAELAAAAADRIAEERENELGRRQDAERREADRQAAEAMRQEAAQRERASEDVRDTTETIEFADALRAAEARLPSELLPPPGATGPRRIGALPADRARSLYLARCSGALIALQDVRERQGLVIPVFGDDPLTEQQLDNVAIGSIEAARGRHPDYPQVQDFDDLPGLVDAAMRARAAMLEDYSLATTIDFVSVCSIQAARDNHDLREILGR